MHGAGPHRLRSQRSRVLSAHSRAGRGSAHTWPFAQRRQARSLLGVRGALGWAHSPFMRTLGHPCPSGPCPVAIGQHAKGPLCQQRPLDPPPGGPSPCAAPGPEAEPTTLRGRGSRSREPAPPREALESRAWALSAPRIPSPRGELLRDGAGHVHARTHVCTQPHTYTLRASHVTRAPHAYACAHTTQRSLTRVHPPCTAHAHAPPCTPLEPPRLPP